MKNKKIVAGVIVCALLAGCVELEENEIDKEVPEIHTFSLKDYFIITGVGLSYPSQRPLTTNCVYIPIEHEIRRVHLEIYWEAESPLAEKLVLRGVGMQEVIRKIGSSPLSLELENPTPSEGARNLGFGIRLPDASVAVQQSVSVSIEVDYLKKEDLGIHHGICG